MSCSRCGGTGHLSQYQHISLGVCFACNGSGGGPSASSVRSKPISTLEIKLGVVPAVPEEGNDRMAWALRVLVDAVGHVPSMGRRPAQWQPGGRARGGQRAPGCPGDQGQQVCQEGDPRGVAQRQRRSGNGIP